MTTFAYQVVLLGEDVTGNKAAFEVDLLERITELGLDVDSHLAVLRSNQLESISKGAPVVGVFFGGAVLAAEEVAAAKQLVDAGFIVIPVVEDLARFPSLVPASLHKTNGLELRAGAGGIAAVTSVALEVLSLLRKTRKLFISYKRAESRTIAIQLYEHLDKCGFDVFIDTVSIRPGEPFQDVLWHKLSDTDVVILLDTPGFRESRWTTEELARAAAMSLGIVQVVWPDHNPDPASSLCERFYLEQQHLRPSDTHEPLTEDAVAAITTIAETLRARSLSARYHNLVSELCNVAQELGMNVTLQPQQYMEINTGEAIVAAVPIVGIPEALRYQDFSELLTSIRETDVPRAYLLYDNSNLQARWQAHIQWLDQHLPIKSIRITDSRQWLSTLR